jgi:predicted component of type VI protein secretion system
MAFQLVVVRGRSTATAHRLGAGVTVAGRQDGCQLQIRSSQVSRKHCELFERGGQLLVKDLKSSNGTFVNGHKVEDEHPLKAGDELSIGGVKFRVQPAGSSPGDTAPPVAVSAADVVDDDVIALDDEPTVAAPAAPRAPAPAATPPPPPASRPAPAAAASPPPVPTPPPAPQPEPAAEPAGAPELGEDAVADFLMGLDLNDDK